MLAQELLPWRRSHPRAETSIWLRKRINMADLSVRTSSRARDQPGLAHCRCRDAFIRIGLLCSLLLVGLLPAPAAAAAPHSSVAAVDHTIRTSDGYVARIGAFRLRRDPTIGAAARAFGQPSSRKLTIGGCRVEWRQLRLRIDFANYGGHAPGQTTCSSSVGRAQSFVARGRRFRTWEGVRVGQRSESIVDRHSSAMFRRNSWWLRTAVSPFGDESEYAVVRAITANGRVVALGGWIGAAGE